ncbi:MAG: hypothetical protein LBQ60_09990 [Bacteroidales bacterium]|jgi:hypothetical protein|nr:hypothetical protein [Bacteroidales bacterium]
MKSPVLIATFLPFTTHSQKVKVNMYPEQDTQPISRHISVSAKHPALFILEIRDDLTKG